MIKTKLEVTCDRCGKIALIDKNPAYSRDVECVLVYTNYEERKLNGKSILFCKRCCADFDSMIERCINNASKEVADNENRV